MSNVGPITGKLGTGPLTRYDGNGGQSPTLTAAKKRLEELIAQLKSLMAFLPPELQAELGALLKGAEAALAAGDLGAIEALIQKLEKLLETLLKLVQLLSQNPELADADAELVADQQAALTAFYNLQALYQQLLAKVQDLLYGPKGADAYKRDTGSLTTDENPFQTLISTKLK